jgi:iron(III) transport system substrate-binding protein
MRSRRVKLGLNVLALISAALLWVMALIFPGNIRAQVGGGAAKRGLISLNKKDILENAKKEGQLTVVPGFDEASFPVMKQTFEKRYPFLKVELQVASGAGSERFHYDLVSGTVDVDVFNVSLDRWGDYEKHGVIGRYDFPGMVKRGDLKIHPDMIDTAAPTPGLFGNFGSRIDVILYNTKLLRPENTPTGWESCTDPKWKGKFSVDTRYHGFVYLNAAWSEEKLLDFARKIKDNQPIWVQGMTATITRLAAGEFQWMCSAFLHSALRMQKKDPSMPIKVLFPNPTVVSMTEPEGIYAKAKHPNAALLWMEWMASLEAQEALAQRDPGKVSFLVEGSVANKLLKDARVKPVLCSGKCLLKAAELEQRIAVDAWGLPAVKKR